MRSFPGRRSRAVCPPCSGPVSRGAARPSLSSRSALQSAPSSRRRLRLTPVQRLLRPLLPLPAQKGALRSAMLPLLLVLLALSAILVLNAATARGSKACRFRSRLLLRLALAPGNGGQPRRRLWALAQEQMRRAESIEATARERRKLRAAMFAMSIAEPARFNTPTLSRRAWPGSRTWETGERLRLPVQAAAENPYRRRASPSARDWTWYQEAPMPINRQIEHQMSPVPPLLPAGRRSDG